MYRRKKFSNYLINKEFNLRAIEMQPIVENFYDKIYTTAKIVRYWYLYFCFIKLKICGRGKNYIEYNHIYTLII